jgi:arylformamidase
VSDPVPRLYRGLGADALQAQYSARAAVPEHPALFERWRRDGAAYRAAATAAGRARLDLAYGPDPRERIDLFLPEDARPAPLHVFFHGGYWQSMERRDFSALAAAPNAAGLAVAIVGYPLCPSVKLERIVTAARAAIVWLSGAKIPEIRSASMHVAGHSAGGHLAAMLATTDWSECDPPAPACPFGGIAPISGLFDLEPLVHTPMNDALGLDRESARALSPLHAPPQPGCRLRAFVGSEESDEFRRQSRTFVSAWRNRSSEAAEVHCVADCNHFTVLDALYAPDGPMVATALAAIG